MKYKPLLNLKTKSVVPKAISSLYRVLGDLFKYPPSLPDRWQDNKRWNILVIPQKIGELIINKRIQN